MNSSANSLLDLEKEKLKQDLLKQTEMSNKLETLCLQYRQVWCQFDLLSFFEHRLKKIFLNFLSG